LRAISVALVILSHVSLRLAESWKDTLAAPGLANEALGQALAAFGLGELGVLVFFVISGYIITSLMFSETERTGRLSLPRFYLRRTFRIFPAYYAYLAVIAVLAVAGAINVAPESMRAALTYTVNYCWGCASSGRWYLAHAWSLSVEEQFYIVWPLIMVLLGRRRALFVAAGALVVCPMLRVAYQLRTGTTDIGLPRFELIADALATGCVFAGIRSSLHASAWYQRLLSSRGFVAVPLCAVALMELARHPSLYSPLVFNLLLLTVVNVCIVFTIDWTIVNARGRVGRFLNHRAVVYVGLLSYSLYLWQMPFLDPAGQSVYHRLPLSLVFICLAAIASYHLIERPFLRLRLSIERRMMAEPSTLGPSPDRDPAEYLRAP
jgi:peptidoglycan/LPS O-acetylase OafA/YrhL